MFIIIVAAKQMFLFTGLDCLYVLIIIPVVAINNVTIIYHVGWRRVDDI